MNELEFDDKGHTVGPGTFPIKWNKKIRPLEIIPEYKEFDELTSGELAARAATSTVTRGPIDQRDENGVWPNGGNTPVVPEETIERWRKHGLLQVDRKDMTGKHSPLLMPIEADIAFSAVSDYGLAKYGNRSTWMYSESPEGIRRYLDAAIRHAKQHQQEGEFDSESGLPHIYSVLWNAAAAVYHYEQFKKPTK